MWILLWGQECGKCSPQILCLTVKEDIIFKVRELLVGVMGSRGDSYKEASYWHTPGISWQLKNDIIIPNGWLEGGEIRLHAYPNGDGFPLNRTFGHISEVLQNGALRNSTDGDPGLLSEGRSFFSLKCVTCLECTDQGTSTVFPEILSYILWSIWSLIRLMPITITSVTNSGEQPNISIN